MRPIAEGEDERLVNVLQLILMVATYCNVLDHLRDRMLTSVVHHLRKTHLQTSPTNNYHFPVDRKPIKLKFNNRFDKTLSILHLFFAATAY